MITEELIKAMRKKQSLRIYGTKKVFNPFKDCIKGDFTMAECRAFVMSRYESIEAYDLDHGEAYRLKQYRNGFRTPEEGRTTLKPRIPITYDFSKSA